MSPVSTADPSLSLSSAVNSGLATIATGTQQINLDAQQISNPENQNITGPLLDLTQSSLLYQAGAEVVRTSNAMLGTLLDAFA